MSYKRFLTELLYRHWNQIGQATRQQVPSVHIINSVNLWFFVRQANSDGSFGVRFTYLGEAEWKGDPIWGSRSIEVQLQSLLLPALQGFITEYMNFVVEKPSYHEIASYFE